MVRYLEHFLKRLPYPIYTFSTGVTAHEIAKWWPTFQLQISIANGGLIFYRKMTLVTFFYERESREESPMKRFTIYFFASDNDKYMTFTIVVLSNML